MEEMRLLKTYEEVKALSHPLRIEILRRLEVKPMTMAQIGRAADMDAARLYYHIGVLTKINAVRVAETRKVGNLIERYYELVAQEFRFDRELLLSMEDERTELFSKGVEAVIEATAQTYRDAVRAGRLNQQEFADLRSTLFSIRLSPLRLEEFRGRLQCLLDELDAEPKSGEITAHLAIVFIPLAAQVDAARTD